MLIDDEIAKNFIMVYIKLSFILSYLLKLSNLFILEI